MIRVAKNDGLDLHILKRLALSNLPAVTNQLQVLDPGRNVRSTVTSGNLPSLKRVNPPVTASMRCDAVYRSRDKRVMVMKKN